MAASRALRRVATTSITTVLGVLEGMRAEPPGPTPLIPVSNDGAVVWIAVAEHTAGVRVLPADQPAASWRDRQGQPLAVRHLTQPWGWSSAIPAHIKQPLQTLRTCHQGPVSGEIHPADVLHSERLLFAVEPLAHLLLVELRICGQGFLYCQVNDAVPHLLVLVPGVEVAVVVEEAVEHPVDGDPLACGIGRLVWHQGPPGSWLGRVAISDSIRLCG